jgi:type VI secretion system protein VasG
MSEISRSASLFGRLNATALKAIETATGFCKMRGNPYVELVHWVHILLQDPRNDVGRSAAISASTSQARARHGGDARRPAARRDGDLRLLASDRGGAEKGWLYASLQFAAGRVRTGHLLYRHAEDADS